MVEVSNYPLGFSGLEGEEENMYLFEVYQELIIDDYNLYRATEQLMDLDMVGIAHEYDEPLDPEFQRFSVEVYGEVKIYDYTEEGAQEQFDYMKLKEAFGKGFIDTTWRKVEG